MIKLGDKVILRKNSQFFGASSWQLREDEIGEVILDRHSGWFRVKWERWEETMEQSYRSQDLDIVKTEDLREKIL
jgi:hypothetical protein